MRTKQFSFFHNFTYVSFFVGGLLMAGASVGLIAAAFNGPIDQRIDQVQMEEVVVVG